MTEWVEIDPDRWRLMRNGWTVTLVRYAPDCFDWRAMNVAIDRSQVSMAVEVHVSQGHRSLEAAQDSAELFAESSQPVTLR